MNNKNNDLEVAKSLLDCKAVVLKPDDPFTWASGIQSPIYCDNRLVLSYPDIRSTFVKAFCDIIKENSPDCEVIAGVATAGIPWASLIAASMNLPLVYVRSQAKKHGQQNRIEGVLKAKSKVVMIEDLISTGKSSLSAVDALVAASASMMGVYAIFSYGLPISMEAFKKVNIPYYTLTNFETLFEVLKNEGKITDVEVEKVNSWRQTFV